MRSTRQSVLLALAVSSLAGACSARSPEPTPAPVRRATNANAPLSLPRDWATTVFLEREDSLILTLPSGGRQVQRQGRSARFTLTLTPGAIRVRLDTLVLRPSLGDQTNDVIGTIWTARIGESGRIYALQATRGSPLAEEIGNAVRAMIPRLPGETVRPGESWSDSSSGAVRVDIFRATEQRTSRWSSGERVDRNGLSVLPIRLREDYEQLGRGDQSGRQMTMTAQGRRTATYYMTLDGRVDAAVMQDSVVKLITIPATRQSIPTMQFNRTELRFGSDGRGRR